MPNFPGLRIFATRALKFRQLWLCLALVIALVQLPSGSKAAIAPVGGTLTDSSGSLTFTGGPYPVANPSSQATGTPTCNAVLPCDEYALTVSGLSPADCKQIHTRRSALAGTRRCSV